MRKADNTIVFGAQTPTQNTLPPLGTPRKGATQVMPSRPVAPAFPEPVARSAHPTPAFFVDSRRPRKLSDDLVIDEHSYMTRPERGLAFAAVSLALIGVAAAGTYFFFGSRVPTVSSTTTTAAEVRPAGAVTTPETTPPAPPPPVSAPPVPDLPATTPVVDAVRAPELAKAKEPGPQVVPTERPQAANQAPSPAKIQAAQFPSAPPKAKEAPAKAPPEGMSDEALERSGYYGKITPITPSGTDNTAEPKAPSAASTQEPSQFTPPPSQVMPDVKIKE